MAGGALREIFARFGVEFDSAPLAGGARSVDSLTGRLQSLGSVIAGGALVVGLRNFVEGTRQLGTELDNTSQALGLDTNSLQAWRAALASVGVSAEQATPAIQALRRNADAAASGGAGMAADFRALGITAADIRGPLASTDALLRRTAAGVAEIEDPTQRAAVLMRLFGEQGGRLGPLFANGAAGVDAALASIEALGGGMSEEAIQSAKELTAAEQGLDLALLGVRSRIAVYVLPVISRLVEVSASLVGAFNRIASRGALLQVTLVTLGTVGALAGAETALAWVAAAAPFIALAAVVLVAILVFEDLWLSLTTGRGVFQELADGMDAWGADWAQDGGVMGAVIASFEFLKGIIVSIADTIAQMGVALGALEANPFGDITGDIGLEGDPESRLAQQVSDRNRASLGAGEFLLPDSFERFMAVQEARTRLGSGADPSSLLPAGFAGTASGATVHTSIQIDRIDASGLDGPEAGRVIEAAVTRAMTASHDDTIDTLTREAP